ncbi:hypothetical protein DOTSEDRAFT_56040 [Dothistroma septosporum NZE10]|uniref:Uncharacterized protein n=1 Tax=Dothistroma septosporum (strain NZE10 / CBS 128990) TaxID=675120 RepID=N1PI33_DOTSN|nr:hypothetical protein DOTSEDRAFT_56040 [Dothistroma septosporum NZE10]
MSPSSPNSPKSRLGRLFRRRGPSDASSGSSPGATAAVSAPDASQLNGASDAGHVRRRSSKRSIRDFVQGSGRSRSRSGSRRISLQREQLQREPSYNAPQNLPSGAEVAAARALYPDGHWAPVSPTNSDFPLGGSQAQEAAEHLGVEPRGPPIYEDRKSRPTTADNQTNGQTIQRMLAQQQQERLLAHEHTNSGWGQPATNPAHGDAAVTPKHNRHSRNLSDSARNEYQQAGGLTDSPDPLRITKNRNSVSSGIARASLDRSQQAAGQLSHKPDVPNLRKSVDSDVGYGIAVPPRTSSAQHPQPNHTRNSSLQKPLPDPPLAPRTTTTTTTNTIFRPGRAPTTHVSTHTADTATGRGQGIQSSFIHNANTAGAREPRIQDSSVRSAGPADVHNHSTQGFSHPDIDIAPAHEGGIQNSSALIDLSTVVDLRNTEDTDYHTTHAPAVTHETVHVEHHEVREEVITRETHNHHIFHRILPVLDFEVLPPRHFIETRTGGKYEISPDLVPLGHNERIQNMIHDAVARIMPQSHDSAPAFPNTFSARPFHGKDGNHKAWTGPYGEPRTEQWWVHPPTWETGGRDTGQTEPFHLGSEFPEDDGLRTPLPDDTSMWPQQLKRASTHASQKRMSMNAHSRDAREYQDYQEYAQFVDDRGVISPMGPGSGGMPPAVPRYERNGPTILPIRMQHDGRF